MIVFASMASELAFTMITDVLGSDSEVPMVNIEGLPRIIECYDPFRLKSKIARRPGPGDKFPYRNCVHTDSVGSVIEGAPQGLKLYVNPAQEVCAIGYRGFFCFDPNVASDTTTVIASAAVPSGRRVRRVTVKPQYITDTNGKPFQATGVRVANSNPDGTWGGYQYLFGQDHEGRPYQGSEITSFEKVVDLPDVIAAIGTADLDPDHDMWYPCTESTRVEIPVNSDVGLLEAHLDSIKRFIDNPLLPQFNLEDNDIFYKVLDNYMPDTTNWGEFFEGITDAPRSVADIGSNLRNLARSHRAARATVSQLAGIYLFYLYAVRPTPHDLEICGDIERRLREFSFRNTAKLSSRAPFNRDGWEGRQCVQVGISPSIVDSVPQVDEFLDSIPDGELRAGSITIPLARERQAEMLNTLTAAGIPTDRYHLTKFLLEMVPLSFAANWVFGFNEKLDELHLQTLWRRVPVDFVCRSIKVYKDRSEQLGQLLNTLRVKSSYELTTQAYRREYTAEIPELPLSSHNPELHKYWDQLGALFLVRLK